MGVKLTQFVAEIAGFLYGAWDLDCLGGEGAPGCWPGSPWLQLYCSCEKTGWDQMGVVTPERGLSEAQGRLWGRALHARGTRGVEPWLLQTR